ncbi:MAG: FHA domain-containing protein [Cellulomonadaceae bacterium]|jgi:pSer/pThr/pTyr-binding forkhead associated (FHA) protein|nr:FHA domain-containing protein [Cellulomonadaceae bacterium]
MSELTFTLLRLGYLALLWIFVLIAVGVLRRDVSTRARLAGGGVRRNRNATVKPAKDTPPAPPKPTKLTVLSGSLVGTQVPLTASSILIGRAPGCTLVIDDDYASSRHARIFPQGDQWFLEDLNSTNGTFLGDQQIHGVVPLGIGTAVRIGRSVLELQG